MIRQITLLTAICMACTTWRLLKLQDGAKLRSAKIHRVTDEMHRNEAHGQGSKQQPAVIPTRELTTVPSAGMSSPRSRVTAHLPRRQHRAGSAATVDELAEIALYKVSAACKQFFFHPSDPAPKDNIPASAQCRDILRPAVEGAQAAAKAAVPGSLGFYMKMKESKVNKCSVDDFRGKWIHFSGMCALLRPAECVCG